MNKLLYLSLISFALLFAACEEKTEYIKKSYVNEDAVADSIKDPMRNIEWLKEKQAEFDTDESEIFKCRALIYYEMTPGHSGYIFEYEESFSERIDTFTDNSYGCLYQSTGFAFYVSTSPYSHVITHCSNLSEETSNFIGKIIDEKLNNSTQQSSHIQAVRNEVMETFEKIRNPTIDATFKHATNIEVLSCYRLEEVIK